MTSNERELIIVGDGASGKVTILLRIPISHAHHTFSSHKQKESSQNSTMQKKDVSGEKQGVPSGRLSTSGTA